MSKSNDFIMKEEKITNISIFESKVRPILAEFIGSIILVSIVFAGAINTWSSGLNNGVIYGLTMIFLIIAFGDMSGGYFNPVITLGFTLARVLSIPQAVCYFFAQIIGGIVGAALVRASNPEERSGFGRRWSYGRLGKDILLEAMLSEAIPTLILVLTVLITTLDKKKRRLSPLAIGICIILCSAISYSERRGFTYMNPALSFGPAVAYSTPGDGDKFWKFHYVYWVGPLVGTLVASLLYRFVFALGSRRIRIPKPCFKKQPFNSEEKYAA